MEGGTTRCAANLSTVLELGLCKAIGRSQHTCTTAGTVLKRCKHWVGEGLVKSGYKPSTSGGPGIEALLTAFCTAPLGSGRCAGSVRRPEHAHSRFAVRAPLCERSRGGMRLLSASAPHRHSDHLKQSRRSKYSMEQHRSEHNRKSTSIRRAGNACDPIRACAAQIPPTIRSSHTRDSGTIDGRIP
jgi:hypothetical protein